MTILATDSDSAAAELPRGLGIHVPAHPFSETFPPPYRVLLLLALGIAGWALNLHGLQALGIDTEEVLSSGKTSPQQAAQDGVGGHRIDDARLPLFDSGDAGGGARSRSRSPSHLHAAKPASWTTTRPLSIYGIALLLTAWTLFNWMMFRAYVSHYDGDPSGRHAQALQAFAILGVVIAGVWPGNVLWKRRRRQFAKALVPLFHPKYLLRRPPSFPSILLADILTSFAKVFGDVWLTICFLVPRKEHHTWWNGRGSWVVPALVSLPYAIRFLQCLAEYVYAQNALLLTDSPSASLKTAARKGTRAKRPLANALKYASAFPVIWISASQSSRAGGVPDPDNGSGANPWWTVWLLSVLVNSLFSFWWDVTNDWGLELLKPETWRAAVTERVATSSTAPPPTAPSLHRRGLSVWPAPRDISTDETDEAEDDGDGNERLLPGKGASAAPHARSLSTMVLRPAVRRQPSPAAAAAARRPSSRRHHQPLAHTMLFRPSIYHAAIILDLILRFTWSFKLSQHLAQLVELESGVFVLEVAEMLRRTGWVFLRVEWEVVKRARAGEILEAAGVDETLEEGGADSLVAHLQQQQQQHDVPYRDAVAGDSDGDGASALSLRTVTSGA